MQIKYFPLGLLFISVGACKLTSETTSRSANIQTTHNQNFVFDNLSKEGGLKGTSDDCSHLQDQFPMFSLNGGLESYPSYEQAIANEWELGMKNELFANNQIIQNMIGANGNQNKKSLEESRRLAYQWLESMQAYVYKDMNNQNSNDPNRNFRLEDPKVQGRWYHMPWLHTPVVETVDLPGRGRECIWGLTREVDLRGPVKVGEYPLITGHNFIGQNWGSAFYNQISASTLGKVFPKGDQFVLEGKELDWPVGSVVMKLLFSAVPNEEDVSEPLKGAWTIQGYINKKGNEINFREKKQARELTDLAHIQMDVMYKFGTGYNDWIFGTWAYDTNERSGRYWQKMRPIGVQWGVHANQSITLSDDFLPNGYFNDMSADGDHTRVAEEGSLRRLNGPADHPTSSCFQCHARAQWPPVDSKRMPFAPKSFQMHHQIDLMHHWAGEEESLKKCQSLVNAGVQSARGALQCPSIENCQPGGEVSACIPAGQAPVVPGSVGLGFSAQLQLALENITALRNHAEQ